MAADGLSHEVIVNLIAATTTRTRLTVHFKPHCTPTLSQGIKITDAQMDQRAITRHDFHGDWNYTLHPCPTIPEDIDR